MFSDAIKVFLYAFPPHRYAFIPLFLMKSLVIFQWSFAKINFLSFLFMKGVSVHESKIRNFYKFL